MKKFISICSITSFLVLMSIPVGSYLSFRFIDVLPPYEKPNDEFTEEKLVQYIKELRIKYPHIVLAQARLETGNYRSIIFKQNNNLFGMKHPRVRSTTSKGSRFGHAYYNTWRESVIDYAFYSLSQSKNISSEEEYFGLLGSRYAENGSYVEVLKKMIRERNIKSLF